MSDDGLKYGNVGLHVLTPSGSALVAILLICLLGGIAMALFSLEKTLHIFERLCKVDRSVETTEYKRLVKKMSRAEHVVRTRSLRHELRLTTLEGDETAKCNVCKRLASAANFGSAQSAFMVLGDSLDTFMCVDCFAQIDSRSHATAHKVLEDWQAAGGHKAAVRTRAGSLIPNTTSAADHEAAASANDRAADDEERSLPVRARPMKKKKKKVQRDSGPQEQKDEDWNIDELETKQETEMEGDVQDGRGAGSTSARATSAASSGSSSPTTGKKKKVKVKRVVKRSKTKRSKKKKAAAAAATPAATELAQEQSEV
mmetsp:Transcript_39965/g.58760  ORF Transcript_39965/g.58760 Transcript_39965/m.58760 type:complete len:314 (-) Transcript_39965:177-1118(-)|eukprot:CAMPEP_0195533274 /NCGR_PEP_ID=MMETSP0794_2-20130614/40149_1 /TAXON_ID=515487 /ORGANISM="Stephanopyxis turris, Strain CCMP 815" /LENGTH=313 /DNA_ID=CAMNT_0040665737 /DNA_START=109 /DNA_END=1050 /DNA_ORIENTATION=+